MGNPVKVLAETMYYGVILAIVIIVIFDPIILPMLKGSYIRPFSFGHSEPLEAYMESHISLLIKSFDILKKYDPGIDVLIEKGVIPKDYLDPKFKATPKTVPVFYMYYSFKKSILKVNDREFAVWKNVFGDDMKQIFINSEKINLYNAKGSRALKEAMTVLKVYVESIDSIIKNISELVSDDKKLSDPKETMTAIQVKLLGNYFSSIERSYDTRKIGGSANVTLFKIYMKEYSDFIFDDKIKQDIWKEYVEDSGTLAVKINDFLAGDAANKYMQNLPLKIAGLTDEDNKDYKDKAEHEQIAASEKMSEAIKADAAANLAADGGNTCQEESVNNKEKFTPVKIVESFTEHFGNPFAGLFKALFSIGDFFSTLASVAAGLATIAADPIGIIRILIGLILGFIFYISWFIFVVVIGSVVFTALAFTYLALFNVILTIFWVLIYLLYGIIYTILMVIDFATGGLIMTTLRCENLPNMWHERNGFAHDSTYKLKFFCTRPCTSRYIPAGLMCKRLKNYEPSKCPHANIYNMYLERFKQKKPIFYDYKPNMKYFTSSDFEKVSLIQDSYENKIAFKKKCFEKMSKYDYVSKHICDNIDTLFDAAEPDVKGKVVKLCKLAYCDVGFNEDGSVMKTPPTHPFCTNDTKALPIIATEDGQPTNIYVVVISLLFYFTISIIIYRLLVDMLDGTFKK
jgi:hypothetical protein